MATPCPVGQADNVTAHEPSTHRNLGAAKIAPAALIRPARAVPDVDVVSVAARDPERARHYADKHGIERVHPTYEALVEDPDVDAIYNPLPNGLHGRWTLAAIAAGKHVLCEKPFTANANEAAIVARAGDESGLTVMEAFHYRHHPLAARMREVVEQGLIGGVRHIEAWMCFPLPFRKDIRYRLDLAGGATMDAGCYAINMIRLMAASEPEVVSARAKLSAAGGGSGDGGRSLFCRRSDGHDAHVDAVLERAAHRRAGDR